MILFQADYSSASHQLHQCLLALGRPLPTSKVDLLSGVAWQILRQCLNRIYLGRWLASRAGSLTGINSADVKESARDAADAFHVLNQLHLSGRYISASLHRIYSHNIIVLSKGELLFVLFHQTGVSVCNFNKHFLMFTFPSL